MESHWIVEIKLSKSFKIDERCLLSECNRRKLAPIEDARFSGLDDTELDELIEYFRKVCLSKQNSELRKNAKCLFNEVNLPLLPVKGKFYGSNAQRAHWLILGRMAASVIIGAQQSSHSRSRMKRGSLFRKQSIHLCIIVAKARREARSPLAGAIG